MFLGILEILKEFKDWTPKGQALFVVSFSILLVGFIFFSNYNDLKESYNKKEDDHKAQIADLHKHYNELIIEQRKEFQNEVNSFVYSYTREKVELERKMADEIESKQSELNKLKREISKIKNEMAY